MPAAFAPPGRIAAASAVAGRTLVSDVAEGEPITRTRLGVAGGTIASLVPSGLRAFPVTASVAPDAIRAGDRVDVIATFGGPRPYTDTVASELEVLAILEPERRGVRGRRRRRSLARAARQPAGRRGARVRVGVRRDRGDRRAARRLSGTRTAGTMSRAPVRERSSPEHPAGDRARPHAGRDRVRADLELGPPDPGPVAVRLADPRPTPTSTRPSTSRCTSGRSSGALVYFRRDVARYLSAWIRSIRRREIEDTDERLAWALVLGTIPGVIAGRRSKASSRTTSGSPG